METKPGDYVRDEWKSLGLMLFAEGGLSSTKGNMPRIFRTMNPGSERAGDPDLGVPNAKCTPPDPARAADLLPRVRTNCAPQGNVLIVQEANRQPEIPDDADDGGTITLDFLYAGGMYVSEIGVLDIDEPATWWVSMRISRLALAKWVSKFRIWVITRPRF
jgi:hypothetical protein